MKRLGIFFFYEKNGDVDDFITYYLADLNKNLTELVVVCNGKLSEQGRAAFSQFTDNIIVRENKGLDVWAYKTALDSYGWAKLSEFDEIVMTNSTLMGPVRPLKEMFDAMWENQDLDFWGLSIHHGAKSNPFKGKHLYNYLPVHIQSHFIVYRQRFVQNPELQAYWDNMPMIESYTDSVQRYEAVFTKQFEDKGFKWDVYVKTDDYSASSNQKIAWEIEKLNQQFLDEGRNYVLVGPGRWGSSDTWLGIPVKWPHISAARVIVEAGLTNYRVDPSQGTHFFQNLTSFGVGYFTINAYMNDGIYNQDFLNAQPALHETEFLRHVRFERPMTVKMDGKKKQGVVLMPEI